MAMTAESLRAPLLYTIDLKDGLIQQPMRPQLMKGDKQANTIIVRMTDGDKAADLAGASATGSFISPVGGAEIPLPGSVSGNEVRVTLVDECYAEDGYFEANVTLTVGETSRTILSITGHVLSKGSGAVIDIGNVVPNINDIIAQYSAMKQAVEEANAARDAANEAAEHAPYVNTSNNHWMAWDTETGSYVDTGVNATGPTGAAGADGADGQTPYIGENGNWWIGGVDTGVAAQGPAGENGTGSGTVTGVKIGDASFAPDTSGVVDMSAMTAPNANQLNGKDAKYYIQPRNLLDNSWWKVPKEIVNQRGQTSYTGAYIYAIDRWSIGNSATRATVQITENGIVLSPVDEYADFNQNFENYDSMKGKTYTVGICTSDGSIYAKAFVMGDGSYGEFGPAEVFSIDDRNLILRFYESTTLIWAALYEGEYTAENLPPYVPKGYAVELAECQRYYYQSWDGSAWDGKTVQTNVITGFLIRQAFAPSRLYGVELPVTMRKQPTIEFYSTRGVADAVSLYDDGTQTVSRIDPAYGNNKAFIPGSPNSGYTTGTVYTFHYSASADL